MSAEKGHSVKHRADLDERAAEHYRSAGLWPVPLLAEGDEIRIPDHPADRYVVDGFHSGGMLVEVTRTGDGQEFSLPRFLVSRHDDGQFLTAVAN